MDESIVVPPKRTWVAASFDIVGFTQGKVDIETRSKGRQTWPQYLASFFGEMSEWVEHCITHYVYNAETYDAFGELEFENLTFSSNEELEQCDNQFAEIAQKLFSRASVWKLLGDEVVFCVEARSPRECAILSLAFIMCGFGFQGGFWRKSAEVIRLPIKGAVWTFSGEGDNIFLDSLSVQSTKNMDFAGPAIDCGFRLAATASPKEFIVSNELVHFFSKMCRNEREFSGLKPPSLYYLGRKSLKGVLAGEPYPIYCAPLARHDALDDYEHSKGKLNSETMASLSTAFMKRVEPSWHEPLSWEAHEWFEAISSRYREVAHRTAVWRKHERGRIEQKHHSYWKLDTSE